MNNLPDEAVEGGDGVYRHEKRKQRRALARLRHQSRWAGLLFFSPWLGTILCNWPHLCSEPFTIMGLLPGFAAAVHMQKQLLDNLASNHRPMEKYRLFSTLGAANWITLWRAAGIIVLAGFLPMALKTDFGLLTQGWIAWVPGSAYLVIATLDLLDGYVARRQQRETELGKQLDIVTDAAGLLIASLLAVALGRLPSLYLLVGLAYYVFVFGIWFRKKRSLPIVTLRSRPYSRIIAGCQMGLVAMALLPNFKPAFTGLAGYIFMTPLLAGFFRDWLVVSCRISTDGNQQSRLDIWTRSLVMRFLPLVLRLIVLSGGIAMLAGSTVYLTHLSWQLVHSVCCLLTALGCMGRSAGLFLVVLLGSNQSPFGISLLSMTLFGSAAALVLLGTGSKSLWAPEERILYRRRHISSDMLCEAP